MKKAQGAGIEQKTKDKSKKIKVKIRIHLTANRSELKITTEASGESKGLNPKNTKYNSELIF